jgi:hypothetical protein
MMLVFIMGGARLGTAGVLGTLAGPLGVGEIGISRLSMPPTLPS